METEGGEEGCRPAEVGCSDTCWRTCPRVCSEGTYSRGFRPPLGFQSTT